MTPTVKTLMYRGGRYRFEVPPTSHATWSEADWIAYIDGSGEWQPDIIDKIMTERADHVAWLLELFAEMQAAGFTPITIDDDDLVAYSVDKDGAEAVIRELFQVDDMVTMTAAYPRHAGDPPPYDDPYRMQLAFLLCNGAWESLADYSIPCQAADEALDAILTRLEEKYLP